MGNVTLDASSALVKAANLATTLFINSEGRLSLNIATGNERHFFWVSLEGKDAFELNYLELPTRREDVLPLDIDRMVVATATLAWRRALTLMPGALFVTDAGTHLIIKHFAEEALVRINLATRAWEYLDDNEVGQASDSWTLNGYVDGHITVSASCAAMKANRA